MAMHYGVSVVPARPYKPRDKAKVEFGVLLAERWIIAALRHRTFFSIEELNQAIRELRDRINQRPFRKREGSRASQFAALDKPALNPLPAEPFDLSQWSRARVNIDYHIAFDTNYYSVPYNLVQELVEVRSTPTTIELFKGPARGVTPACAWSWARRHHSRAPSTFPSGASGMDSIAHGALGAVHRPAHCPSVRTHSRRQAAPGDGLPFLSGDHSTSWPVLIVSRGSCCGTSTRNRSLPLSEREVDFEKLARCRAACGASSIAATATARQHPRPGVLRLGRNSDAQTTYDR
jgi:hypothetical protein